MRVEVQYQLQADDAIKGVYLHTEHNRISSYLAWFIFALSTGFLFYSALKHSTLTDIIVRNIILEMITAGCLLLIYWFIPYRCRKNHTQAKSLQALFTTTFDDNGIHTKADFGESHRDWSFFRKYKQSPDLLLLYEADSAYHLFPRRFFKDGDFETLIEFLKTKLPQK